MANLRHSKDKPSLYPKVPVGDVIEDFQFEEFPLLNITDLEDLAIDSVFEDAVDIISLYGIPLVILIGCIGNTLSLIVFLTTHLRFQSSSIYLAFLNAADTMFLVCLLLSWLKNVEVQLINRQVICQSVLYFSYVGGFLSVYTVVSFTIERWVIVFHPLKKNTWCTRRKALLILSVITICALVMYSFTLWSTGLVDLGNGSAFCSPKPQFYRAVQVITTIDTFITLIMPAVIIIVLNVNITTKIWQFVHKDNTEILYIVSPSADHPISRCSFIFDKNFGGTDDVSGSEMTRKYSRTNISYTTTYSVRNHYKKRTMKCRGRGKLQMRTTRSLLIVSTVFVSLNLPSHAFRIYAVVTELLNPTHRFSRTALLWQHLFQLVYYLNFAMNFFLYSACSKSFRQAFHRLCLRMKRCICVGWTKLHLSCKFRETLCMPNITSHDKK